MFLLPACFSLKVPRPTVLCQWPVVPGRTGKTQHALTVFYSWWAGDLLIHEQKFQPNGWFAREVTIGWRLDNTVGFILVIPSLPKQRNVSRAASQLSQNKCTESIPRAQLMSNNLLFHNSSLTCLPSQQGQFHLPDFFVCTLRPIVKHINLLSTQ